MDAQKAVNNSLQNTTLQKFKNSKYRKHTAAKRQPAVIGGTTQGWTVTNVIELVRAVNNHLPKQTTKTRTTSHKTGD